MLKQRCFQDSVCDKAALLGIAKGLWSGCGFPVGYRVRLCVGTTFVYARRSTKGLESEIAMLSERFGEAAAEAKANGKALMEKEALLGAVTAQVCLGSGVM